MASLINTFVNFRFCNYTTEKRSKDYVAVSHELIKLILIRDDDIQEKEEGTSGNLMVAVFKGRCLFG